MSPALSRCNANALLCSASGSNPNPAISKPAPAAAEDDGGFLLRELQRCESRLHDWFSQSEANVAWFARDPMAALRAAEIGMDEEVLNDLEDTMRMIARKINAARSPYSA
jgi:hypothetical protein